MYVTQLLPNEAEARVIRAALSDYLENHPNGNPFDHDVCWKYIAKISTDLVKAGTK